MKAIVYHNPGGPEVLQIADRELPTCKEGEVLVEVKASGINKPDIFQRKGNYNAPKGAPQDIPGLEVSGVVVRCGGEVSRWKVGDEICALLAGGGYANYVAVDERHCLPKPPNLSFLEAASLPETVFTVWHNVFERGQLSSEESVLIHGGSGGIGITGIQLAKLFAKRVYTTAGSDDKCRKCEELGAAVAINYRDEDFEAILKDLGVDVILDSIGGSYFGKNINILNPDGRLIYINTIKGPEVELNLGSIMQNRLTISGSTLRGRSSVFKAGLAKAVEKNVWPLVISGQFKPVIYKSFSYTDVIYAHRLMESGTHFGKIVLQW